MKKTVTMREWLDYRKTFVGIPKDADDNFPLTKEQISGFHNQAGERVKGLMQWLTEDTGVMLVQTGLKIATLGDLRIFFEAFF